MKNKNEFDFDIFFYFGHWFFGFNLYIQALHWSVCFWSGTFIMEILF